MKMLSRNKGGLCSNIEWYNGRKITMLSNQTTPQSNFGKIVDKTHRVIQNSSVSSATPNHPWDLYVSKYRKYS